MDYSRYKFSGKVYSGAEKKIGILINDEPFIVKFRKPFDNGEMFNHVSEYIGSHVFASIGIETQESFLGKYRGEDVVVLKDFKQNNEIFVPFNDVGDSSLERDRTLYRYSYSDIIRMLEENSKITDVEMTKDRFWDMYIVDAFIGNFDRHGGNWGFLKKDNSYRMAPVFDNGSSLFPRLNTDEKILEVLSSKEKLEERIYRFPTSQIMLGNKKSYYYDVINSLDYERCNEAVIRIANRINMDRIYSLIDTVDVISDTHKMFYKTILNMRYEKFIKEPYRKLTGV